MSLSLYRRLCAFHCSGLEKKHILAFRSNGEERLRVSVREPQEEPAAEPDACSLRESMLELLAGSSQEVFGRVTQQNRQDHDHAHAKMFISPPARERIA